MTRKEITVRQRLQMPQERLRIVRLCTLLTGDADVAEDLAQETLLEAWRSADRLRDPDAWRPWLSGIARNVCLRWQRKHLSLVRRGAAGVPAGPAHCVVPSHDYVHEQATGAGGGADDVTAALERRELAQLLDRAMGHLPHGAREMLVERYID